MLAADHPHCHIALTKPTPAYAGRMLKLAYLAPAVLEKLLIARVPPTVSVKDVAAEAELPWADQEASVFG